MVLIRTHQEEDRKNNNEFTTIFPELWLKVDR